MAFRKTRLILAMLTFGIMAGCKEEISPDYNQTVTETVVSGSGQELRDSQVVFKQLLYSKIGSDFIWEGADDESMQDEIRDKYKEYLKVAPGGFVLKETEADYYICVSIGKQTSAADGFRIESITMHKQGDGSSPLLSIGVKPVKDEPAVGEFTGETYVTRLITVAKADLPHGMDIREISMTGA